jgi:hypothetical protein
MPSEPREAKILLKALKDLRSGKMGEAPRYGETKIGAAALAVTLRREITEREFDRHLITSDR